MDVKISGSDISINNGNIDNSIVVNGDNIGAITTGYKNSVIVSNSNSINWSGLQADLNSLNAIIQMLADGKVKNDLQNTSAELQNAVDKKDESSVWSTLKKAGKSTLDFIKTLSLQVLPSLILKKFG